MKKRIGRILSAFGLDGFLAFLLLAILLAYCLPEFGAAHGVLSLRSIADYGVWLIFLFYGMGMSVPEFGKSLAHWRLHLVIHLMTFLLFPAVVLAAYECFAAESTRGLWLGIFYVAALPSTVSSSVVMVSIARGNVPAAIFNASLSSLLGVILTPLWMSLFLTRNQHEFHLSQAVQGLMLIVVLPVVLGMILQPRCGAWIKSHRKSLRYFDQSVVLLIVYTSFCESFQARAFDGFGIGSILALGLGMALLFFVVLGSGAAACRVLDFNREDTITALFCGSKKSLMHGTAMSKVLFAGMGNLGVILLPIMLYHAMQLILAGVIAKRWGREPRNESTRNGSGFPF